MPAINEVAATCRVWGQTTTTLRDSGGNVKFTETKNNTLTQSYVDWAFSQRYHLLAFGPNLGSNPNTSPMMYCRLGTSNTPTLESMSGVQGAAVGYVLGSITAKSAETDNTSFMEVTYTFNPGVCTGSIGEAGLSNTSTGTVYARQVFNPVLTKEAGDTLVIVWKISMSSPTISGTIAAGNRDGLDVDWTWYIPNKTRHRMCFSGSQYSTQGCFYLSPYVSGLIGTSNDASDLVNDGHLTLKGTQLWHNFFTVENNASSVDQAYVPANRYKQLSIIMNSAFLNKDIAEIVFYSPTGNVNGNYCSLGRVTFSQPLQKISGYVLKIVLRFGMNINTIQPS